jgi:predicted N-acyltransferase
LSAQALDRDSPVAPARAAGRSPSLSARVVETIAEVDRDAWDRLFPGDPEGWAFHCAVEECGPPGFRWRYLLLEADGRLVAGAPVFLTRYRIDTTLQGPLRRVTDAVGRALPGLLTIDLAALGSPVAESCQLGFAPDIAQADRPALLERLLDAFEALADAERCGCRAVKDAALRDDALWTPALARRGYSRLAGLPTGILELPAGGFEAYWASLSRATRKDLKRKMRALDALRIEVREDVSDVLERVGHLYDQTVDNSELTFEHLPHGFFQAVLARNAPAAKIVLYWHGERLAGFNLLLETPDRLVDKYIGLDYEVSRRLNLYWVSWVWNVRHCYDRGLRIYQSGQAFYSPKLRLGCRLSPNRLHFRHDNAAMNLLLRLVARVVRLDRFDPAIAHLMDSTQ